MKSPRRDPASSSLSRLLPAALAFLSAIVIGGWGYYLIGDGRWPLDDCMYMAVVTLSTVGFSETLEGMDHVPSARAWTVTLILLGSGTLLYFASTLTAIIVEGDLGGFYRRNRMRRTLERIKDHVIVCGVGATGIHVIAELSATDVPFVVIDRNQEAIDRLTEEIGDFLYVVDEATLDHALLEAGVDRARGIVCALTDDPDNLYVTIASRALNENLRIVSKCVADEAAAKLRRAGADVVVSPSLIGGNRMASEMLRPSVVQFLDNMLSDRVTNRGIEEIAIPNNSQLKGQSLARANFRRFGDALVVAIRHEDGEHQYNPPGDHRLQPGQVLIVMAETARLGELRKHITG